MLDKLGPLKIQDKVGELFQKYEYTLFAIESNFQQKAYVVDVLKDRFPMYPIIGVESRVNKLERLINMQTIVNEHVFFPMNWQNDDSQGALLIRQLCSISAEGIEKNPSYPEQFIDGPDGLEGLIRICAKGYNKGNGSQIVEMQREEIF